MWMHASRLAIQLAWPCWCVSLRQQLQQQESCWLLRILQMAPDNGIVLVCRRGKSTVNRGYLFVVL